MTHLQLLVLAAVHKLQPRAYGPEIRQNVIRRLRQDISADAIYACLDQLKANGLVAKKNGEGSFRVTDAGNGALGV